VFFATPNGIAMQQARALVDAGVRVIDLAADFRIKDVAVWEKWYGMTMPVRPAGGSCLRVAGSQSENIGNARLIANSAVINRCVVVSFLIEAGADPDHLVADAKSGYRRRPQGRVHTLFSEAADNFKAGCTGTCPKSGKACLRPPASLWR
jgi:N-acetyl-gamma-glutamyl-phosphate reductase